MFNVYKAAAAAAASAPKHGIHVDFRVIIAFIGSPSSPPLSSTLLPFRCRPFAIIFVVVVVLILVAAAPKAIIGVDNSLDHLPLEDADGNRNSRLDKQQQDNQEAADADSGPNHRGSERGGGGVDDAA